MLNSIILSKAEKFHLLTAPVISLHKYYLHMKHKQCYLHEAKFASFCYSKLFICYVWGIKSYYESALSANVFANSLNRLDWIQTV